MLISDYNSVYNLWLNTSGMGLNAKDDSEEGIKKYLLRNPDSCFVAENNGETEEHVRAAIDDLIATFFGSGAMEGFERMHMSLRLEYAMMQHVSVRFASRVL